MERTIMSEPADTYLRGPRTKVNDTDYIEDRQEDTVIINGVKITIDEFRRRRPKNRKRFTGLKKK